jgi:tRNA C32,U32 (ribose-2'-O)-methylase TrmJ
MVEGPSMEARYQRPVVLLVGSEKRGLSSELKNACSPLLRMPIARSGVDSLDVAVAAGILLCEMFDQNRQRQSKDRSGATFEIASVRSQCLRLRWSHSRLPASRAVKSFP